MQGVLGARVRPGERDPGLSGRTGDNGKGALAAPEEVRQDEAGQVDDGEDVNVEDVAVHLDIGVLPPRSLTLAGVVNHYVQLREKERAKS